MLSTVHRSAAESGSLDLPGEIRVEGIDCAMAGNARKHGRVGDVEVQIGDEAGEQARFFVDGTDFVFFQRVDAIEVEQVLGGRHQRVTHALAKPFGHFGADDGLAHVAGAGAVGQARFLLRCVFTTGLGGLGQ